jgi:hypothetical protein
MLMFDALVPVRAGAAAGGAAGAPAGGVTKFSVDPDQAQKMIDGLKDAVRKLMDLQRRGLELQYLSSPGPDPVSEQAKNFVVKTAGGETGGYVWANREAQKALEQTIINIEKALAEYRGTDEAAQTALKG